MLEEFQIKGQPRIKKVIAISELAKYGPNDKLLVLADVDNIDDLNEQVEMFAMDSRILVLKVRLFLILLMLPCVNLLSVLIMK